MIVGGTSLLLTPETPPVRGFDAGKFLRYTLYRTFILTPYPQFRRSLYPGFSPLSVTLGRWEVEHWVEIPFCSSDGRGGSATARDGLDIAKATYADGLLYVHCKV